MQRNEQLRLQLRRPHLGREVVVCARRRQRRGVLPVQNAPEQVGATLLTVRLPPDPTASRNDATAGDVPAAALSRRCGPCRGLRGVLSGWRTGARAGISGARSRARARAWAGRWCTEVFLLVWLRGRVVRSGAVALNEDGLCHDHAFFPFVRWSHKGHTQVCLSKPALEPAHTR